MVVRWRPSGQDRLKSENLVFAANSALSSPAARSEVNTEETGWPAAACTVRGTRRSSSQVTPCPPSARSTRRPVTMLVWLGSVTVISTSVRALSVDAPSAISRCSVGVPVAPSCVIAPEASPSTEITTTRVISPAEARAASAPGGVAAGAGEALSTRDTRATESAGRRTGRGIRRRKGMGDRLRGR